MPGNEALMKVCFLVSEFFGWGKYGGYGSATRVVTSELARRGLDVTVVTPGRGKQPESEVVDGVRVLSYPPHSLGTQYRLLRECGAEIYHSQEPSLGTWLAMKAAPQRVHVVTCRDTRLYADWLIEMRSWVLDGSFKTLLTFPYENNLLVTRAVRAARAVFCPNEFSRPIAQKKYGLHILPGFLPSPVRAPQVALRKDPHPTVCFVGRWDQRKRPEIFFELARAFPEVRFIAMGEARTVARTEELKGRYGGLDNLELLGFVDQFSSSQFQQTLARSWILVNTALREGLPRTFLEAAYHKCAILSRVDPDGFASRFGWRVDDDDFAKGLRSLLAGDAWRKHGEEAHDYVAGKYSLDRSVDQHLEVYRGLVEPHQPVPVGVRT
jgi:glycosyltransferase involved in cell wall biosynthesis